LSGLRGIAILLKVSRQPDGSPEIFYSIQGEGLNAGKPAVFLRLALCNLACIWCDTKYTWDWQHYSSGEQITEIPINEVQQQILKFSCAYLVVTGGEPMLQQKQLTPLLSYLKKENFHIEIETNGTIIPDPEVCGSVDHWSVSPKLQNSGNSSLSREIPEAYQFFSNLASCHFKYVIQNEDDFLEVQNSTQKYGIIRGRTFLMPEAQNTEILLERSRWLVELCKSHKYLFSTRLQILLWGNRRGV
jgi:organic radical activating enzyme